MKDNDIVLILLQQRILKGKYPCVVKIRPGNGGIFKKKFAKDFVLVINDDSLNFYGLKFMKSNHNPKLDFKISLNNIKNYKVTEGKIFWNTEVLTNDGYYVSFEFVNGIDSTMHTTQNFKYLLNQLKEKRVRRIK